ncbi:MAG TPA: prolipoprotein diacylglyceryl transferase family protein [Polyangiaceae bacterium]
MHPVLFELPLPRLHVPLGFALAALAVLGVVLGGLGARRRSLDLTLIGVVAALGGLFGAVAYRDRVLALGPIAVPSFGALLALSLGLGTVLALRAATRSGLDRERALAACIAAACAGVLGARLAYAALHPRELGEWARLLAFRDGGLVAYGGLVAGLGAAWLALGRKRTELLLWLDAVAPGFPLGVLLTRIGCWLEGCDFGRLLAAGAPGWLRALGSFPSGSRAWVEQVLAQKLSAAAPVALPVHPTELYEALGGALLAGLVLALRRRQRAAGHAGLVALAGYAIVRLVVDLFRDGSAEVWAARVLALFAGIAAVVLWPRLTPASRSA